MVRHKLAAGLLRRAYGSSNNYRVQYDTQFCVNLPPKFKQYMQNSCRFSANKMVRWSDVCDGMLAISGINQQEDGDEYEDYQVIQQEETTYQSTLQSIDEDSQFMGVPVVYRHINSPLHIEHPQQTKTQQTFVGQGNIIHGYWRIVPYG